jgi:hypothetical protein
MNFLNFYFFLSLNLIDYSLFRQSFFNRAVGVFVKDKTIPQGAATSVYACVCPRAATQGMAGAYLVDCGPAAPNDAGRDESKELREALWNASEADLASALEKAGLN